ncbi:hypothetical protein G6O06_004961 [Salmonella enterica subsp. enterica]|uniref:hypothetical protein n=1 Tax=Salmonella enterica TaxID=28901 RepID=UPI0026A952E8|nr:hypothetical protein [Salmonella enterica]EEO3523463.1 hypothetical protein [Salmonella enterica subsp. enterica serovar Cerro]EIE5972007.1 hypothetical protein [Salmonella enterica]
MWTHCPTLDRVVVLMMKKVKLPADAEQYTELVKNEVALLRTKMGGACITLNYRTARINANPVLVIDFFSDRGRLYTLRYDLPAGTSLQNSRRLSEILFLTRKELEETGQYVA